MNQLPWPLLRPQHQLNPPPSSHQQSIQRNQKSKPKVTGIASKSFSESFLNEGSHRKMVHSDKKKKEEHSQSIDTKNKKLSQRDFLNPNKTEKKKALLNVYDNKMLKEAIKAKSQSNRMNMAYSNAFKYKNIDKTSDNQSKDYLRLNAQSKSKNQSSMNDLSSSNFEQERRLIKSISSTTKNQQLKKRAAINNLQSKGKKNHSHDQNSFSQRKRVSEKIQSKLKELQNSHMHQSFVKQQHNSVHHSHSNGQDLKSKSQFNSLHDNSVHDSRLQYRYAFRTKKGKNISNPKKVNQDSILVKQNISKKDLHMIAVADGHGPSGHLVSQFVVKNLSKLFSQQINEIIKFEDPNKNQSNLISEGTLFLPRIYDRIQNALSCSQINAVSSGCTLVNVIIQKNEVLCANVGDSRAILARQLDKKNWELIYLSEDHKPSSQPEKKRILKCGGRIHAFKGERGESLGPLRVWLPNQSKFFVMLDIQGLAMTRSFGDNISKTVGVTHKPEMIKVKIDEKDKFILVASDGVWEFISNQEILQLIAPYYKDKKLEEACDALLKYSYDKWTQGDDSVVDDISFVLVFLHC